MPTTLKAKILDQRMEAEDVAEFVVSDEELEILEDFRRYARDLPENPLVQDGIPTSLSLRWNQGEGIKVETKVPADEKIDALLMKLRPFILKNEDTHFYDVRNILVKATSCKAAIDHLNTLRHLFSGSHLQSIFVIGASSAQYPEGTVMNSEKMLEVWLNGYRFHKDKDKQKKFSSLHNLLPPEFSIAFFLLLISDKIKAILDLEALISVLSGDREHLRAEVRLEPPIQYRAFLHPTVSALQFFDRSKADMGEFPPKGPWQESFDLTDLGALTVPGLLNVIGQLWMQGKLSREIGEHYYFFRAAPGFRTPEGASLHGMEIIVNLKVEVLLGEDPLSRMQRKPAQVTLERLRERQRGKQSSTVVLRVISSQKEMDEVLAQEPTPKVEWIVVPRVAFMFAYWPLSGGAQKRSKALVEEGQELTFENVEGTDLTRAWEYLDETTENDEEE